MFSMAQHTARFTSSTYSPADPTPTSNTVKPEHPSRGMEPLGTAFAWPIWECGVGGWRQLLLVYFTQAPFTAWGYSRHSSVSIPDAQHPPKMDVTSLLTPGHKELPCIVCRHARLNIRFGWWARHHPLRCMYQSRAFALSVGHISTSIIPISSLKIYMVLSVQ